MVVYLWVFVLFENLASMKDITQRHKNEKITSLQNLFLKNKKQKVGSLCKTHGLKEMEGPMKLKAGDVIFYKLAKCLHQSL